LGISLATGVSGFHDIYYEGICRAIAHCTMHKHNTHPSFKLPSVPSNISYRIQELRTKFIRSVLPRFLEGEYDAKQNGGLIYTILPTPPHFPITRALYLSEGCRYEV
jgi:hypothetical protein